MTHPSREIVLPNDWRPRPHQLALWRYLEGGGKRAVAVWHRRAGKDSCALNFTATAAHRRIGTYWHMLPLQTQARKVVWDGIDRAGRRIVDQVWPRVLRAATNKQEMKIELKCGSIWQLCGSDNYDSLVGANPVGVVFSEYSLANPAAWDYIRPILAENGGWALFIYTARGRNHGHTLFQLGESHPKWFCQRLTVADTGIIPPEAIEEERAAGMSPDMIDQEFYCSFDAAAVGSYYGREMNAAEQEGRITAVPWEPSLPVHTFWDLGLSDSTAIWFAQVVGREVHAVDYLEHSGVGLDWYARELGERPYAYGEHVLPHDASVRELGTGKSRVETLAGLGLKVRVLPSQSLMDGINAVRLILPRTWFDKTKCARGVDALRLYRREWDEGRKIFHDRPWHDWTSHPADAFRYLAEGLPEGLGWRKLTYTAPTIA